jgi:hypothetical protein
MTILSAYKREILLPTDDRLYNFSFPCVGPEAVEVYEITGVNTRNLVKVQDYSIRFSSHARDPLKSNGSIRFNRPHIDDTIRVVIERNTPITQLVDMPVFRSFNGRMVEFVLDKLTMICQEIAERKCGVQTITPITQLITFTAYDDFKASVLNFAMDKMNDILIQIDTSSEDCRDRPDET